MIEIYLVGLAILLILSVFASKISDRFGVPALVLFLVIGMLAGSDGLGGIYFDDPVLAQTLGTIALIIILFSGGLDTRWSQIRPIIAESVLLATVGVVGTAFILGFFAHWVLGIPVKEGILLGAIVSSTDAAAVFAILRSRGIHLAGNLKPLLEFESGSNDPMAVFLTIGMIQVILNPTKPLLSLVPSLLIQMALGLVVGFVLGKAALYAINRLKLGYSGLYPVLSIAIILMVYGLTNLMGGSGFLAVYITGLVMSQVDFLHRRSLSRFYDGLAWLMQITMFLVLGLLVFPSRMLPYWLPALVIALFLILVARPVSVLIALLPFKMRFPEKLFISWVGLRGAVPIVLAIYPRIMGVPDSDLIFNVVFFVVMTSVLFQGTSISPAAKLLGVKAPPSEETSYPVEVAAGVEWTGELLEIEVPPDSWAVGKAIFELSLPERYLVVLIARGGEFIIPNGSVILQAGDKLLGLSDTEVHGQVVALLRRNLPAA